MAKTTIKRMITFWKIFKDPRLQLMQLSPFEVAAALERLSMLPRPRLTHIDRESGIETAIWVDSASQGRIIFGRARDTSPLVVRGGRLGGLKLEHDEALTEPTHIVIFKEGVIGVAYNPDGPRMRSFQDNLAEALHDRFETPLIGRLVKGNILETLDSMKTVFNFEMVVAANYAETVEQKKNDTMLTTLDVATGRDEAIALLRHGAEMAKLVGSAVVRIGFPQKRGQRSARNKNAIEIAKYLLGRPDVAANVFHLTVRGLDSDDNSVGGFNFVKGYLSRYKAITLDPSRRNLDDESGFQAIEAAYCELKPDIDKASVLL